MQVGSSLYTQPMNSTSQVADTKAARNDYLNSLRQKFPSVNIVVKDFSSDAEIKRYAMGCSGSNVAIASSLVDKLASDPATAEKFEKNLADGIGGLEKANAQLKSEGIDVTASGTIVKKDGSMNFWGIGRQTVSKDEPSMMENILKNLDEKRTKEKEEELQQKKIDERKALYGGGKALFASAENVSKLTEKISALSGEYNSVNNGGFDFKA